jgi:hypothetical protein
MLHQASMRTTKEKGWFSLLPWYFSFVQSHADLVDKNVQNMGKLIAW